MAYLDGELAPVEVLRWEKRLAEEPVLRAQLQSLKKTWDALDALQTTSCDESFTTGTLNAVAHDIRTQGAEPVPHRGTTGNSWQRSLVVLAVLTALTSFLIVRYSMNSIDRELPPDLAVVGDSDSKPQEYSDSQEQETNVQLEKSALGHEDSKEIFSWMGKVLKDHERELLRLAPPRVRENLHNAPPFVRRQALWRILQRNSELHVPTAEEIERLMNQLSEPTRKQLSQAETVDAQRMLLKEWMRTAMNARMVRSEVSTEEP